MVHCPSLTNIFPLYIIPVSVIHCSRCGEVTGTIWGCFFYEVYGVNSLWRRLVKTGLMRGNSMYLR